MAAGEPSFSCNGRYYPGGMTNLAIGLCIGLAVCVVLTIMWKFASRLREHMNTQESEADVNDRLRADRRSQSCD
jgi:hypothetical protein